MNRWKTDTILRSCLLAPIDGNPLCQRSNHRMRPEMPVYVAFGLDGKLRLRRVGTRSAGMRWKIALLEDHPTPLAFRPKAQGSLNPIGVPSDERVDEDQEEQH